MMTVGELKEMLDDLDDETEVRFASQPGWPFEYSISSQFFLQDEEDEKVLWLAEDKQLAYLPGNVKDALGWGR